MAASALVATAGGQAGFTERHKVDEILESLTAFTSFSYRAALHHFESFAEEIHRQPSEGRTRALQAVAAVADSAEDARVILRIACAVARNEAGYPQRCVPQIGDIAKTLGRPPPPLQTEAPSPGRGASRRPYCITVGNQKGGTGKSTTAVHLAVGLLSRGHRVGCIDLDGEQGTFSHYLANRRAYAEKSGEAVAVPVCRRVEPSEAEDWQTAESEDRSRLNEAFASFADFEYLVIDTPGNQSRLSRLGHMNANVLITPVNDSFLDIDVLAEIDPDARQVLAPSAYAEMVMAQIQQRIARGGQPIHWFVMRNRLAQLVTRNSRDMTKLLDRLAERMGFRLLPGFSERMIFRELFYKGLTLVDLPEEPDEARLNPSRLNARQEISHLVDTVAACRDSEATSDMASFCDDLEVAKLAPGEATPDDTELAPEDAFLMLKEAMRKPHDRP
jgi:chromosome partitioning protein